MKKVRGITFVPVGKLSANTELKFKKLVDRQKTKLDLLVKEYRIKLNIT